MARKASGWGAVRLWRPAGLAWEAANLAGLAIGLFPALIVSASMLTPSTALPGLRTVAVAQVSFLLLVYPLLLARHVRRLSQPMLSSLLKQGVGEAIVWLALAAPFVAVGAYLGNATLLDAARVGILTASTFVAAWGLACLACRGAVGASLAALIGVLAVLAGPFADYLAREFLTSAPGWLWHACPATLAWSVAVSRAGTWIPQPLWAWLIWPGLGFALLCIELIHPTPPIPRLPNST